MKTDNSELKKFNTKIITPLIVLFSTSIIAVFSYLKHYPVRDWFMIVFATVVIFLVIGLLTEKMITRFIEINYEKAMSEKAEAERLEEESRAAMEAEANGESGVKTDSLEVKDII
ncbi:hypothetical protein SAMN04487928_102164 [Butyrivibrio proteoclasticus]|uniref:Uncharacterized protein n=1 Tax=Butyrivibrio proteoclasticus TaxID=43305 RepID=A0A1I5QKT6_9FIRM|nr:hypothetical protein [Butyrivibrio proteoclasticus]SFP46496.1 hypothetical protein SAMN04487928_102164 [Butyrivibrio proteoclasticus]